MDDLTGRVAVVTGAASGIGRALAERLGTEGMKVVLADVEQQALEETAAELASTGRDVLSVRTNVADADDVDDLGKRAVEHFGAVHVVCNNAGVVTLKPIWEQTLADWEWVLGVDLWGVVHGVRTFVPMLLAQGEPGHVVNTASIAGLVPSPMIGPYNVAKAGVVALSETLDMELRELDAPVGVSVLCPGVVPTRIAESGRNRPGGREAPLDIPTQDDVPPTAMTAAQVAGRVVDAILGDEFWVLTHEGSSPLIEERASTIAHGGRPTAPPVF